MPLNVGDVVTRFVADTSSFDQGVNQATVNLERFLQQSARVSQALGAGLSQQASLLGNAVNRQVTLFDQYGNAIENFGKTAGDAAQQMSSGFTDATVSTASALSLLRGTATRLAGMFGIGLSAWGIVEFVKRVGDLSVHLGALERQTHLSIAVLGGLRRMADETGVSVEAIGYGVRFMIMNLQAANDPTSRQAIALKKLGIELDEVQQYMSDPEGFLERYAEGMKKITDYSERLQISRTLAMRGGLGTLPLFEEVAKTGTIPRLDPETVAAYEKLRKMLLAINEATHDLEEAAGRTAARIIYLGERAGNLFVSLADAIAKTSTATKEWVDRFSNLPFGLLIKLLSLMIEAGGKPLKLETPVPFTPAGWILKGAEYLTRPPPPPPPAPKPPASTLLGVDETKLSQMNEALKKQNIELNAQRIGLTGGAAAALKYKLIMEGISELRIPTDLGKLTPEARKSWEDYLKAVDQTVSLMTGTEGAKFGQALKTEMISLQGQAIAMREGALAGEIWTKVHQTMIEQNISEAAARRQLSGWIAQTTENYQANIDEGINREIDALEAEKVTLTEGSLAGQVHAKVLQTMRDQHISLAEAMLRLNPWIEEKKSIDALKRSIEEFNNAMSKRKQDVEAMSDANLAWLRAQRQMEDVNLSPLEQQLKSIDEQYRSLTDSAQKAIDANRKLGGPELDIDFGPGSQFEKWRDRMRERALGAPVELTQGDINKAMAEMEIRMHAIDVAAELLPEDFDAIADKIGELTNQIKNFSSALGANDPLLIQMKERLEDLKEIERVKESFESIADSISQSIDQMMEGVMEGTQNLSDVFRKGLSNILSNIGKEIFKQGVINPAVRSIKEWINKVMNDAAKAGPEGGSIWGRILNAIFGGATGGVQGKPGEEKAKTPAELLSNAGTSLHTSAVELIEAAQQLKQAAATLKGGMPGEGMPGQEGWQLPEMDWPNTPMPAGFETPEDVLTDFSSSEMFDQFSMDFAESVESMSQSVMEGMTQFSQGMKGGWDSMFAMISQGATGFWGMMQQGFGTLFQNIMNGLGGIGGGIMSGIGTAINFIGGLFMSKGGMLPGRFIPIHAFQEGGLVTRPTLGIIAEGGEPEAVIPQHLLQGDRQNQKPVHVTVVNDYTGALDPRGMGPKRKEIREMVFYELDHNPAMHNKIKQAARR